MKNENQKALYPATSVKLLLHTIVAQLRQTHPKFDAWQYNNL